MASIIDILNKLKCPACGTALSKSKDAEGREWYVCGFCGAQFPVKYGTRV